MATLSDLIAAVEARYDPSTAESWDAIGLTCGDPREVVERVLLAVDPVPAVVDEAVASGAQLLVTHHPLLLAGVHSVATTSAKGELVHRMIRARIAHLVAHTNADAADPGVSDALAARLGLTGLSPLDALPSPPLDTIVVYVPVAGTDAMIDAMAVAGAGQLGDYDRAAFAASGVGTFRPGPGARPAIGHVGRIEQVDEARVEMVLPPSRRDAVVAAMRGAHPYEQPAFEVFAHQPVSTARGTGRVGELPRSVSLREFTAQVAGSLPATPIGVRAAGDPDRTVRRVAVCGGSGAPFVEHARRAGADAYVTGDLKHHATSEAVTEHKLGQDAPGMALLDAGHWATEAPWLDVLAGELRADFGTTVDITVSRRVTDPWSVHAASPTAV